MKRIIAIAATLVCCMGNEMPARANSDLNTFTKFAQEGSQLIIQGSELIKVGNTSSGCARLGKGADQLAKANAFYPDQRTLDAYYSAKATFRMYCL